MVCLCCIAQYSVYHEIQHTWVIYHRSRGCLVKERYVHFAKHMFANKVNTVCGYSEYTTVCKKKRLACLNKNIASSNFLNLMNIHFARSTLSTSSSSPVSMCYNASESNTIHLWIQHYMYNLIYIYI